MAETILAIKFNGFVLLAASGSATHYYIKITDEEDKMTELDSHKVLITAGENGPRKQFSDYLKANLSLNKIRAHGQVQDTPTTAAWVRGVLANALRSKQGAYEVNSLLGGYDTPVSEYDDTPEGAHVYYLDYLGTMQSVPYGAHGYGAAFVLGLLDRRHRSDMTPQEGIDLLQQCCDEVKKRVMLSSPHFVCRVITKDGTQLLNNVH